MLTTVNCKGAECPFYLITFDSPDSRLSARDSVCSFKNPFI